MVLLYFAYWGRGCPLRGAPCCDEAGHCGGSRRCDKACAVMRCCALQEGSGHCAAVPIGAFPRGVQFKHAQHAGVAMAAASSSVAMAPGTPAGPAAASTASLSAPALASSSAALWRHSREYTTSTEVFRRSEPRRDNNGLLRRGAPQQQALVSLVCLVSPLSSRALPHFSSLCMRSLPACPACPAWFGF